MFGVCNHIYDSNWYTHLGNETRTDQNVQMYRLSFPLVVRIWHKLIFWREIKTPAHLRHCRDSPQVKSLHLGPATCMSPEYPAPREPGIQMTCNKFSPRLKRCIFQFQAPCVLRMHRLSVSSEDIAVGTGVLGCWLNGWGLTPYIRHMHVRTEYLTFYAHCF